MPAWSQERANTRSPRAPPAQGAPGPNSGTNRLQPTGASPKSGGVQGAKGPPGREHLIAQRTLVTACCSSAARHWPSDLHAAAATLVGFHFSSSYCSLLLLQAHRLHRSVKFTVLRCRRSACRTLVALSTSSLLAFSFSPSSVLQSLPFFSPEHYVVFFTPPASPSCKTWFLA